MKTIALLIMTTLLGFAANGQNPDFLKMVQYGSKAPSGHNTQPWKFKLNKNNIEVYPDFDKELPIVDKNHRELYISLGCAVENICIAANEFGYQYTTKIIKQNDNTFIRIFLDKETVKKNPLFTQITKRQTNRSIYNSKKVQQKTINELQNIKTEDSVSIHFYKFGTGEFSKLSEYIYKGNEILFGNKSFKKELLDWVRFNAKDVAKNKDGLAYNVLGSPALPKWLGKMIVKSFLKAKPQNKSEKEKLDSSSHLVLIVTKENTPANWILTGQALERFFLKYTELGIAVAFSNQPCEVSQLAQEIQKELPLENNYPMLLMRIGYTDKMPYSVRKDIDDVLIK